MQKPVLIYGGTLGAVAVAVLARWLLDPWLGSHLPLTTVYGAVAVSVFLGGYSPALFASAIGFFACSYFFVEPRGAMWPHGTAQWLGLAAHLFSCGLIIGLGQAVLVARRRDAEQMERLRTTLASIGDGVITTDRAGRVTNLNAVAETLTGWTNSDAVGQSLDVVFHIVSESTREPVENPVSRALKEGVAVGLANDTLLVAKDGTQRPIDDSTAPIRNRDGDVIGCVLVFRDVTERRRAEQERERGDEAVRVSEARFRLALRNTGVLVYTTDSDLRYTWLHNPHPAFRPEDVIGRRDEDLLPPEQAAPLTAIKRRVLNSGTGEAGEIAVEVSGSQHVYNLNDRHRFWNNSRLAA